MTTGPEHYAEAERLIAMSWEDGRTNENIRQLTARAQAHATLALAAATALTAATGGDTPRSVRDEWRAAIAGPHAWTVQR